MACLRRFFRIFVSGFFALSLCVFSVSAQDSESADSDVLLAGLDAYKNEDWSRAALLLRESVGSSSGESDSSWYMMIMSQIYAGYYEAAVNDCDTFFTLFPDSAMSEGLHYQKGRILHLLGKNSEASTVLADFCVHNPESPMYVSALFWLAECFFDECDYASAESIYSQIVREHSDDSKSVDSAGRLEEISRGERERKLLYLLKMTGEEYLSLKEDYDRLSARKGPELDGDDIKFIEELVSAAREAGLGIDESKLKRLNKKLNQ
ncbi:MAG: hypothetical protein IKQ66_00115 [Treponema sp.]|nr:hypothetical protein [Treponema sp.]MBR6192550.1 hypothetical protein [Treponema sp.]